MIFHIILQLLNWCTLLECSYYLRVTLASPLQEIPVGEPH